MHLYIGIVPNVKCDSIVQQGDKILDTASQVCGASSHKVTIDLHKIEGWDLNRDQRRDAFMCICN